MKQYIVDAFTEEVFKGNPAAVCVMKQWLSDDTMQKIAMENSLSETAFAVRNGDHYCLRWFTPGGEIDLCGHATLATAYVITHFIEPEANAVHFDTLSGMLHVTRKDDVLTLNFPSYHPKKIPVTEQMVDALGVAPVEAYMDADMGCILKTEEQLRQLKPNQELVRQLDGLGLHVTAQGCNFDCVTRSFVPKCNVPEDPVCGRGHCHVVPIWAEKLGKNDLAAYQASARSGVLYCRYAGERVYLSGKAVLFAESEIHIK